MLGLSGFEVAIILLFAFLIFGPDKLPQIARTIGRGLRQFRSAQDQMNKVIQSEVYDPIKDLEPLMNPFAGFSLDNLGGGAKDGAGKADATKAGATKADATKADATKADAAKKKPAVKDADTSKDQKATGDTSAEGSETTSAEPLSSEKVQAALAVDADKAKKKALREAARKAAINSAAGTESFAERRARLESEHAKAKDAPAPAPAVAAVAPETAAKAKPKPAAEPKPPTKKPTTADDRKEDEQGN
ncbi:MAG: twin-arginine translocase TatA/TatE family subunit [Coriobacteriia bacterium]|nr:twin-arginine translocase TatA/TatE family subunit [Coriobacteriia bacterium]